MALGTWRSSRLLLLSGGLFVVTLVTWWGTVMMMSATTSVVNRLSADPVAPSAEKDMARMELGVYSFIGLWGIMALSALSALVFLLLGFIRFWHESSAAARATERRAGVVAEL